MNASSEISKTEDKGILPLIFASVGEMPTQLRELICMEMDWSIPTFYRKIRENKPLSPAVTRMISQLTLKYLQDKINEIYLFSLPKQLDILFQEEVSN